MRWLYFFCLALAVGTAHSQPVSRADTFRHWIAQFSEMSPYAVATAPEAAELLAFCEKLPNSPSKRHLRRIFRRVQRRYLREYIAHESFGALLSEGQYNCLSASALMAVLLKYHGYDVTVWETPFHIFLEVALPSGTVLIETTDPWGGLRTRQEAILASLRQYATDAHTALPEHTYLGEFPYIFQAIDLEALLGLQYFNEGVRWVEQGRFDRAATAFERGFERYPTTRFRELITYCRERTVAQ